MKIKPEDAKAFHQAVDELNATMRRIKSYIPGANYYLAMETLTILNGESHDDRDRSRQDRVMESQTLIGSGGGDW